MTMATNHRTMTDPWRRFPDHPVVDAESEGVLEEAIFTLTILRSPMFDGDAVARLHALRSLVEQAEDGAVVNRPSVLSDR